MWYEFDTTGYTEDQIYAIMDDAVCHGFEVKYINSKLYYREAEPPRKEVPVYELFK